MKIFYNLLFNNLEAVRKAGGVTQTNLTEVEVECLPDSIPDHIIIDMSQYEIGDSITIGDLVVGEGVKLVQDADDVVASVLAPRLSAEDEAADAAAEAAPEAEAGAKKTKDKDKEKDS